MNIFDNYRIAKMDLNHPKMINFTSLLNRSYQKLPAQPLVVILTDRVEATRGCINAAAKLIKSLKQQQPNLKIHWIIRQNPDVVMDHALLDCADEAMVIPHWYIPNNINWLPAAELLETDWLLKASLVIGYPQIPMHQYFMSFMRLILPQKTQIMSCWEYDVTEEDQPRLLDKNSTAIVLHTGLAKDSAGIFMENFPDYTQSQLLALLKQQTSFFQAHDPLTYHQNHLFFFAYFNSSTRDVLNLVSPLTFCTTIAAYTRKSARPEKFLEIVCPFTDLQLMMFESKYLFKENINKIEIIKNGQTVIFENPSPSQDGRNIKVYAELTVTHEVCVLLMMLAYQSAKNANLVPLIGCTGDQSLAEVLSLPGAVPFYQVMSWKEKFFIALKNIVIELIDSQNLELLFYCSAILQHDPNLPRRGQNNDTCSVSNDNFSLCENDLRSKQAINEFVELTTDFLLKPAMLEQISYLHDYLAKHKNLYINFPAAIQRVLQESYPEISVTATEENAISQFRL